MIDPRSPCGPMMPSIVVKKPRAKTTEKRMVADMNTPNCMKSMISASRRKAEPPMVVQAPDNTEMPTSTSVS